MGAGYLIKVQTIIRSLGTSSVRVVDQKQYYTDTFIKNILPGWVLERMSDFHINFIFFGSQRGDIPKRRINKDNRDKTISDFLPKDINITPDNIVVIKIIEEHRPAPTRPAPTRPAHIASEPTPNQSRPPPYNPEGHYDTRVAERATVPALPRRRRPPPPDSEERLAVALSLTDDDDGDEFFDALEVEPGGETELVGAASDAASDAAGHGGAAASSRPALPRRRRRPPPAEGRPPTIGVGKRKSKHRKNKKSKKRKSKRRKSRTRRRSK